MRVLTAGQMRAVDRRCIDGMGVPGLTLMENASNRVFEAIARHFPNFREQSIIVVCGKGNNGGDGLATARHIVTAGGKRVRVVLLAPGADLKGDALTNLDRARAVGIDVTEAVDEDRWIAAWNAGDHVDLIVDAIFGTGLTSSATGVAGRAISDINASGLPVISIDVPSGLSSDTGAVLQPSIHATVTVALQCMKLCHALPPACDQCGLVEVAPIGIPDSVVNVPEHTIEMLDASIGCILAPRPLDSHKGHYGHVLVVAGSFGKTGAAVMTGVAAYRAGAGLVTVATPRSCLPIVAAGAPELMTEPLAETIDGTLAAQAAERALQLADGKDVLLIGPGLTTHPATMAAVRAIVAESPIPIVLDADGINCFAGAAQLLGVKPGARAIVATPHPGELARLTGEPIPRLLKDRPAAALRLASELGIHTVMKGYRTLIATPDGRLFVNPTGNPGMATGGSGDVLTGIIGGLLAQALPLTEAVNLAVYLHGLSGDMAAAEVGEISLMATDLIRSLPAAISRVQHAP